MSNAFVTVFMNIVNLSL